MDNLNNLVNAIVSGDNAEANTHFEAEVLIRTNDAVESMKPHIAKDMFGQLAKEL